MEHEGKEPPFLEEAQGLETLPSSRTVMYHGPSEGMSVSLMLAQCLVHDASLKSSLDSLFFTLTHVRERPETKELGS